MKIFLKAFAALVLLTLAVWAIRSDEEQEAGNVNAAPRQPPAAGMTRGQLDTRSYFDGQGDRSVDWPAGAVPEDGLPALLRDYVAGPAPETLQVFPSLLAGCFGKLEPVAYRVEKREGAEGVEIRLSHPSSSLLYVFEKEPPHRLVRFEREDGTVYRMAKCERLAYWEMHDPGDEAWLPPARALTP
jgi:hypothetical protein